MPSGDILPLGLRWLVQSMGNVNWPLSSSAAHLSIMVKRLLAGSSFSG